MHDLFEHFIWNWKYQQKQPEAFVTIKKKKFKGQTFIREKKFSPLCENTLSEISQSKAVGCLDERLLEEKCTLHWHGRVQRVRAGGLPCWSRRTWKAASLAAAHMGRQARWQIVPAAWEPPEASCSSTHTQIKRAGQWRIWAQARCTFLGNKV